MTDVTASRIRAVLVDIDFPCSKQEVVRHAETRAGEDDAEVVRALRSLPLGDYANVDEVVRSVDTVEATARRQARRASALATAPTPRSPNTCVVEAAGAPRHPTV